MKISLVTPLYNNASGLTSSLASSLNQTYPYVERIVIDGGSSDGSLDVLKDHQSNLDKIVSETDKGIYDALNKGIGFATGDIIGILHSDDLFADTDVLSRIADLFLRTDADFIYGDLCYVSRENPYHIVRHWKAGEFVPNCLKRGWIPPHPTVYVRRELFERFGVYDLRYRIAADYDWMLRLLGSESLRVAYLKEVLVFMRTGGVSNRSFKNIWVKSCEDWEIIRSHQVGGFRTLFFKNFLKIPQFLPYIKNTKSCSI